MRCIEDPCLLFAADIKLASSCSRRLREDHRPVRWDDGIYRQGIWALRVKQFIEAHPETDAVANDCISMLLKWVPLYQKSQRAYLTIAVGCTGGKHRSVYMTERIGEALSQQFEGVTVTHRDMPKS